jgi:dTDP-4-dehydrorhamnose 3,5-epimerase
VERISTRLEGPLLLQPAVHGDARGFLVESFRHSVFERLGIREAFVQDNHSRSGYGVVRGLHFQVDPPAAKLVRCARGAIADVLVDIRPGSPTYGQWEAYELSDANMRVLYAPVGFAHGFAVLTEVADVLYKQSAEWTPHGDRGIAYDDPQIGIVWPVPEADRIVSERDRTAPRLADMEESVAS